MTVSLVGNVLTLTGAIGLNFDPDAITQAEVVYALSRHEDDAPLTVHLNSPGGSCEDGMGIYNALRARKGKTHIVVHGYALSCGSLIAMAGDRLSMSHLSIMMIHDVRGSFYGTASDIPNQARYFEVLNAAMANAYSRRTKKPVAAVRSWMEQEVWFNPDEAVAAGLADDVIDGPQAIRPAAFAYGAFMHAPQSLVALANENGWTLPASSNLNPENPMPPQNPTPPSAVALATARIRAILTHAEAEGRKDLAEHLAYETEMTAEAAGATLAKAPKADDADSLAAAMALYEERRGGGSFNPDMERRLNGEGLNGGANRRPGASMSGGKVDLVAAMKRRHGVK